MEQEQARRLVIFDLDKTLARVNVSFAFGKFLFNSNKLGSLPMLSLVTAYALHLLGIFKVEKLHELAFRLIFSKRTESEIRFCVEAFLKNQGPLLFRTELVSLMQEAKCQNHLIWIQSSSPECLVLPIARQFGVEMVLASRYQVGPTGTFTGVQEVVNGQAKRKLLDQYLEKNLLSRRDVTAYTDSILDLPLLEGVGTPVAVCPDPKLKEIAEQRNWQIWHEKQEK